MSCESGFVDVVVHFSLVGSSGSGSMSQDIRREDGQGSSGGKG